jgi:hypothetical protein
MIASFGFAMCGKLRASTANPESIVVNSYGLASPAQIGYLSY